MKVLGHRIKNYYTAIHTPFYSEEKNDFFILRKRMTLNFWKKIIGVYNL